MLRSSPFARRPAEDATAVATRMAGRVRRFRIGPGAVVLSRRAGEHTRPDRPSQIRERLLAEGAEPESSAPERLGAFIRAGIPKREKAVKFSGARLD